MKKCPVCGSGCFDDMLVCFGCMHRFEEEGAEPNGCAFSESPTEVIEEPPARVEIPVLDVPVHARAKLGATREGAQDPVPFEARYQLVFRLQPA